MTIANVASEVPVNAGQLLTYLGLRPDDPKAQAVVAVCNRYDLDPLLKHVIVIPQGGVYITRDGLLHIAHRSGQFDGMVVDQEPTLVDNEWVARVSVYRKDMRHPFTFPGRYPVTGSNKQYAPEMALKAAEAHALRRAFSVAGLPSEDEQRPAGRTGGLAAVLHAEQVHPETSAPEGAPDAATSVSEPATSGAESLTKRTRGHLYALFAQKGVAEADQLSGANHILGTAYTSRSKFTEDDAARIIAVLETKPDVDPDADYVAAVTRDQDGPA